MLVHSGSGLAIDLEQHPETASPNGARFDTAVHARLAGGNVARGRIPPRLRRAADGA